MAAAFESPKTEFDAFEKLIGAGVARQRDVVPPTSLVLFTPANGIHHETVGRAPQAKRFAT